MQLMAHQQRFVQVAREFPRYGWFAKPGVGKTIGTLAAIDDAKAHGYAGKTLIVCPKSIMRDAWEKDAAHFPRLSVVVCWDNVVAKRRRLIATDGADVLIINPALFKKHAEDFHAAGVTRLVIDESSMCKNPKSDITEAAVAFSDRMTSVYLLSGTPAPNSEVEYIPQMRIIDRGVFGPIYLQSVYRYFDPVRKQIGWRLKRETAESVVARLGYRPPGIMKYRDVADILRRLGLQPHLRDQVLEPAEAIVHWEMKAEQREEFLSRLRSRSWSLLKEECVDLPPQTHQVREVELSTAESKAYRTMLDELRVDLGDGETINAAAAAKLMKLRQIAGGVIYVDGHARPIGNAKLDELVAVLEEIGVDQRVVIWAEFTAEIDRIVERIVDWTRRPCDVAVIDGRANIDQRQTAIRRFQDLTSTMRYVVCQPQAAGHGITLTAASYAVYFSHSFSPETYEQSRDRIHRVGQRHPCTYVHLVAKSTVDEAILRALQNKGRVSDEVMRTLKKAWKRSEVAA